ncbi:hypothetical protein QOT17_018960 [Balamuthia mandrillaris]
MAQVTLRFQVGKKFVVVTFPNFDADFPGEDGNDGMKSMFVEEGLRDVPCYLHLPILSALHYLKKEECGECPPALSTFLYSEKASMHHINEWNLVFRHRNFGTKQEKPTEEQLEMKRMARWHMTAARTAKGRALLLKMEEVCVKQLVLLQTKVESELAALQEKQAEEMARLSLQGGGGAREGGEGGEGGDRENVISGLVAKHIAEMEVVENRANLELQQLLCKQKLKYCEILESFAAAEKDRRSSSSSSASSTTSTNAALVEQMVASLKEITAPSSSSSQGGGGSKRLLGSKNKNRNNNANKAPSSTRKTAAAETSGIQVIEDLLRGKSASSPQKKSSGSQKHKQQQLSQPQLQENNNEGNTPAAEASTRSNDGTKAVIADSTQHSGKTFASVSSSASSSSWDMSKRLGSKTDLQRSMDSVRTTPPIWETFTVLVGRRMKSLHNVRLGSGDTLQFCYVNALTLSDSRGSSFRGHENEFLAREKKERAEGMGQRALSMRRLYSHALHAVVLLVDKHLNYSSPLNKEFIQACLSAPEFHFGDIHQQLQEVRHAMQGTPLSPGDCFVTKHSNLEQVHVVFHLVADSSTNTNISDEGKNPLLTGLHNILLTASRYDVATLSLPIFLQSASQPSPQMLSPPPSSSSASSPSSSFSSLSAKSPWSNMHPRDVQLLKGATSVVKLVRTFLVENALAEGEDSALRTIQFVCGDAAFLPHCQSILASIFHIVPSSSS